MRPRSFGPSRGAIPWGLIGLIGLVATIEWTLDRHADDFTPLENLNWSQSARAARREATRSQILCFGTSMMEMGVIPRVIEERTGLRAFNLAVCAGPPQADEVLLRRTLDAGAQPSAILVDFHPHCLQVPVGPRWTIAYWPDLATALNSLELAWTSRDPDFFAKVMTDKLLSSCKVRHQLRASLLGALKGESKSMREALMISRRQQRRNRGACLVPKNPNYHGEIRPDYGPTLLPETWSCAPINETYVRRFLALAASREIPVFWLIPPFSPGLQARREQKGLDAQYTQFVKTMQDQFPNLSVIDGRRSGYVTSVFIDAVHLDRQGATTLSVEVAEVLGQSLNSHRQESRWVDLPAYRDRPTDLPLEDMIQSVLALRAAAKARK